MVAGVRAAWSKSCYLGGITIGSLGWWLLRKSPLFVVFSA